MDTLEILQKEDLSLSMPIDGMRLIEASAGTGKTFTIAGLYARLVIEEKVALRHILVMTFTRAACGELRTRLRERLQLCASLVDHPAAAPDGPEPDKVNPEDRLALALLRRVRARDDETLVHLRRRIDDAVNRMDEAAVVTIHGFCQRVLRDYAAQVDGGGQATQLESSDRDLLEDIAADLWLKIAGDTNPERLAALQQLANTPAQLAQILGDLVYFHGPLEPAAETELPAEADTDSAKQDLAALWQKDGERACAIFDEWHEDGRLHGGWYRKGSSEQLHSVCARLSNGLMPGEKELSKFSVPKLRKAVNKAAREAHGEFPDLPVLAAIDTWLAVSEQAAQRRQGMATVLLHELQDQARAALDRRKRELARMSYDDQIERVHAGLTDGSSALITALREQYPYAMIDEFQDTNPRQFEIFRKLYENFGSLLIIGDPKQAIYGFRGGDVHAYLEAAKLATGRATLTQNFRSSSQLLRAIEALFAQRGDDVFVEPGIDFEAVRCGNEPKGPLLLDTEPAQPLTLWQIPEEATTADAQRAVMALAAAVQIAELLDPDCATLAGERIEPGSIAVLVNKHDEADLVLSALRALHIPAVSVQKQSVFGTEQAGDVLRLLDALLAPESLRLACGALATLLLGRTLADFDAMQNDETEAHKQLEYLADLRRIWLRRGVLAMLERVMEQRAAELLDLADGERRLSNLMQLAELLQDAAHSLSGPRALRDRLALHIRDADDHREDEQLRLESDAACVQVMTLHASKGLEFDLVLLPFMAMRAAKSTAKGKLARFHRDGKLAKRLITTDSYARSADDEAALALERRESLAGDVRLLYVGVTRARHACWMSVEPEGGAASSKKTKGADEYPRKLLQWVLGGAADGAALAQAAPTVVSCQAMPNESRGKPHTPPQPATGEARQFPRALKRDWWVHSFSQLNRGERDRQVDIAADHEDASVPAVVASDVVEVVSRPRGAEYGNAVHAILEHADFAAWRSAESIPESQLPLLQQHLRQAGYSGRELEQAQVATGRMLLDSLNAPFIGDTRLVDLPPSARCAEMRFHFGIAGAHSENLLSLLHAHGYQHERTQFSSLRGPLRGLMHGIIDLVCFHDNHWWVIDYKTNHLGDRYADYGEVGMQAAVELHGYDLQYLIYSVAAHRWLKQVLGAGYDYTRDFGGVRYLFLRGMHPERSGMGVFADKPPTELIEALDGLLAAPGRVAA